MNVDLITSSVQNKMRAALDSAANPSEGVSEAIEIAVNAMFETTRNDILLQAQANDRSGIRAVPESTRSWYEGLINFKLRNTTGDRFVRMEGEPDVDGSVDAEQRDILPSELINQILVDIRSDEPGILSVVSFAPAGVQRWFSAEFSGAAVWGALTDPLRSQLKASFATIELTLGKLMLYYVIPKSIRDLEIGYVDLYFREVSRMLMYDGIVEGVINGTGVNQPIGLFRLTGEVNADKTAKEKELADPITAFTPSQLAPILLTLSKDGKRRVPGIALLCNTKDRIKYVDPALLMLNASGQWVSSGYMPITAYDHPKVPEGKMGIAIPGHYVFGFAGIKFNSYDQTLALDDADLFTLKGYGNGRATDDNVCVVVDPSFLQPLYLNVKVVSDAGEGQVQEEEQEQQQGDSGNGGGETQGS